MQPRYDSGDVSPEPLAQPLTFYPSGRTMRNRFLKGPTAERLATWDSKIPAARGIPTERHVEVYRRWAESENSWGMVVTGNVMIEFNSLTGPRDACVTPECPMEGERFEMFKKVAAAAKSNGNLVVAQVSHCGRQVMANIDPEPISASDIPLPTKDGMVYGKPRPATEEDIARVTEGFAYAAEYLEKAGFDGVELHAAHGYLLSQFLARDTNLRTDEYGTQTTENRLRLIKEICLAIKARVSSNFIVGAKLNSVEFSKGGITAEDAREVCEGLEEVGIDYVQLSGGNFEDLGMKWTKESTRKREAYFLEWVEVIMQGFGSAERKMKVFLAGGLRSVGNMVRVLDIVDGVALARPAIQEPRLVEDILAGRIRGTIRPVPELENDMIKGVLVAQTQTLQVSQGYDPLNVSDPQVFEQWNKDMGVWYQKMTKDAGKLELSDVVEFTGPTTQYGTMRAQELEA